MSGHITEKDIIVDFMKSCTVEVTPGGADKIDSFPTLLREDTTVYVTFLPGSDFADTVRIVKRLRAEGMNPVPHFAARSIPNKVFLQENLKMLQGEVGVEEALLIGGAVDKPVGDFASSMDVMQTGLFEEFGIKRLGLAGHPEGTPDFPASEVSKAIRDKNAYAKQTDMSLYIATQFCFEAQPIIDWDKRIREEDGNELPIHIGIPGLATIKTLIRHAQACGVGNSIRVLTKQAANITKLLSVRMPDKLVRDLAVHLAKNPDCGIKQTHLYPLGGLRKSASWMYAVQDGNFELDEKKGGFKITVDLD